MGFYPDLKQQAYFIWPTIYKHEENIVAAG